MGKPDRITIFSIQREIRLMHKEYDHAHGLAITRDDVARMAFAQLLSMDADAPEFSASVARAVLGAQQARVARNEVLVRLCALDRAYRTADLAGVPIPSPLHPDKDDEENQ